MGSVAYGPTEFSGDVRREQRVQGAYRGVAVDNRGGWGQLPGQEAAALAERELAEDDAVPPEDPSDEPDVEFGVELVFSEPGFAEPAFSAPVFSELDLSGVVLLSGPGCDLSEEPDSVGGAERLSVR